MPQSGLKNRGVYCARRRANWTYPAALCRKFLLDGRRQEKFLQLCEYVRLLSIPMVKIGKWKIGNTKPWCRVDDLQRLTIGF